MEDSQKRHKNIENEKKKKIKEETEKKKGKITRKNVQKQIFFQKQKK